MNGNPATVSVSLNSIEALAEPQFVLEHEGRVYLTVALIEIGASGPDEGEGDAELQEIKRLLEGPRTVTGVVLEEEDAAAAMNGPQSDRDG